MPDKIFAATASFQSPSGQFLIGSALSATNARQLTATKDTGYNNYWIPNSSEQTIYSTSDSSVNRASTAYVYVQAAATNAATPITLWWVSGSNSASIASLKSSDWAYIPVKQNNNASDAVYLKVENTSGAEANVAVLFAETGSF